MTVEDLPLLDQEILVTLKKIERCLDNAELSYPQNINEQKFIEIILPDNRSKLERTLFVHMMEQYLLKYNVNFESTYDLSEDKSKGYMRFGIIRGENIQEMKEKIINLKSELINGPKTRTNKTNPGDVVIKIEILEDKTETKKITLYINAVRNHPRYFNRREKSWVKLYELARDQRVPYHRGFFNYFNSNKNNPLYKREGFKPTKILNKEYDDIIPKIEIKLISQKKITQQLNSA